MANAKTITYADKMAGSEVVPGDFANIKEVAGNDHASLLDSHATAMTGNATALTAHAAAIEAVRGKVEAAAATT